MYGAYSKIPVDTFQNLVTNAGMVLKDFDPTSPTVNEEDILGPTQGGNSAQLQYEYIDLGEDIDNCPKNTKELKRADNVTATASGTFVALNEDVAKWLLAHCDATTTGGVTKLTPRMDIDIENDFHDLWIVGDYSDKNTGASAGFLAIHLIDAFSTGGFQLQTTDKNKATFAYEFTGHFSLDAQDTVPFEVYMKQGAAAPGISLNRSRANVAVGSTVTLTANKYPTNATVTWASNDTDVATVSGGVVTGEAAGYAVISASITTGSPSVTYTDICTVQVVPAST